MEKSKLDKLPQTPMWAQYASIKKNALDSLLFYRMGDFYELFFDDAEEASSILGITLTARNKNEGQPIPMCGVPFHSSSSYINKLLAHGKRVAICEQTQETSATKGLVNREIVRIVSPGMAYDQDAIEPGENNFTLALSLEGPASGAICAMELSTGASEYAVFSNLDELRDAFATYRPREILVPIFLEDSEDWTQLKAQLGREYFRCVTSAPDFHFSPRASFEILCQHFGVANLEAFGLHERHFALGAVGAIFRRAKETQKLGKLQHLQAPLARVQKHVMQLDESTIEHLDIFPKPGAPQEESLFYHLNRTETAPGARKLREFLARPSTEISVIKSRQDAIQCMVDRPAFIDALREEFKGMLDLERLMGKIGLQTANPRDLLALREILARVPRIKKNLEFYGSDASLLSIALTSLHDFGELRESLEQKIRDEAPANSREGGIFKQGWHPELDELISLTENGKEFLLRLEEREREATGISSLKVKYNKVFGYYLEVTNSNLSLVPKHYVRKQTMTGGERYITDELKKFEDKALVAEERRVALEETLFSQLLIEIGEQCTELLFTAKQLAVLDALLALARAAVEHRFTKPIITEGMELEIFGGRHPTIEQLVGRDRFIANDVVFGNNRKLFLITGPNMAGKSTFMRQLALITLLAQTGSYVPAKSAKIGLVDRIATRVGASDRIGRGQSTFMVEMNEMARILRVSSERSLLLIDEIGRGTSTFDGLALAWAILEDLHTRLRCRTLFATHYHELTMLEQELGEVKNLFVAVAEEGKTIRFLHKVVEGSASGSYGVAVAELAGLPKAVTERAQKILADLEKAAQRRQKNHREIAQKAQQLSFLLQSQEEAPSLPQSSPHLEQLEARILAVDVNQMTPMNALIFLKDLKDSLHTSPGKSV